MATKHECVLCNLWIFFHKWIHVLSYMLLTEGITLVNCMMNKNESNSNPGYVIHGFFCVGHTYQ